MSCPGLLLSASPEAGAELHTPLPAPAPGGYGTRHAHPTQPIIRPDSYGRSAARIDQEGASEADGGGGVGGDGGGSCAEELAPRSSWGLPIMSDASRRSLRATPAPRPLSVGGGIAGAMRVLVPSASEGGGSAHHGPHPGIAGATRVLVPSASEGGGSAHRGPHAALAADVPTAVMTHAGCSSYRQINAPGPHLSGSVGVSGGGTAAHAFATAAGSSSSSRSSGRSSGGSSSSSHACTHASPTHPHVPASSHVSDLPPPPPQPRVQLHASRVLPPIVSSQGQRLDAEAQRGTASGTAGRPDATREAGSAGLLAGQSVGAQGAGTAAAAIRPLPLPPAMASAGPTAPASKAAPNASAAAATAEPSTSSNSGAAAGARPAGAPPPATGAMAVQHQTHPTPTPSTGAAAARLPPAAPAPATSSSSSWGGSGLDAPSPDYHAAAWYSDASGPRLPDGAGCHPDQGRGLGAAGGASPPPQPVACGADGALGRGAAGGSDCAATIHPDTESYDAPYDTPYVAQYPQMLAAAGGRLPLLFGGESEALLQEVVWRVARAFGFQAFNLNPDTQSHARPQWTPATAFLATDHLTRILAHSMLPRMRPPPRARARPLYHHRGPNIVSDDGDASDPGRSADGGEAAWEGGGRGGGPRPDADPEPAAAAAARPRFAMAVYELHNAIFNGYERQWCRHVRLQPRPRGLQRTLEAARWADSAPQHGVLCELALYFLLYSEAANLRHTPELLWFLFWAAAHSPAMERLWRGGMPQLPSLLGPGAAAGGVLGRRRALRNQLQSGCGNILALAVELRKRPALTAGNLLAPGSPAARIEHEPVTCSRR
ncbi:hypothetical protein TSOC_004041 [Tetrabaena socialis]|uniref:Uncharacterized protein n=1 Tax=Tetrabaena socialis TaxID=47790 RepID=A0A2J8AA06_9CHLO|nr:hypothetical protein TSOC_004041 [Tetrabaena socialis]|eukprot:PNH09352.1 hypothetical protein TSOC_004041 [Tetrabaena socialis]